MTTIVKAANAAQFLSLIPKMLGYRPTRSVVLIPFAGARSIGAMRFDLPSEAESEEIDRIAATLIGMVCRLPEADAVAAVAYTDERFDDDGMPHRDLIEALEKRADACGVRVTDALCVAADAWGSHLDPDCPRSGRPLDELGEEPRGAEHLTVAEGDQAAGSELPGVDLAEKERTARALLALEDAVQLLCGSESAGSPRSAARSRPREAAASDQDSSDGRRVDPQALATVCTLDDLPTLFEEALGWDAEKPRPVRRGGARLVPRPARAARHRARAVVRRHVGGRRGARRAAALGIGRGVPRPPGDADVGGGRAAGSRPARSRARPLPSHRGGRAARRCAPGPLATCGWLAWALGRSTHAERYALLACEIEPEHGLAEIVRSFVLAGHLPDWAFRRAAGE